jgi:hypothetical protein
MSNNYSQIKTIKIMDESTEKLSKINDALIEAFSDELFVLEDEFSIMDILNFEEKTLNKIKKEVWRMFMWGDVNKDIDIPLYLKKLEWVYNHVKSCETDDSEGNFYYLKKNGFSSFINNKDLEKSDMESIVKFLKYFSNYLNSFNENRKELYSIVKKIEKDVIDTIKNWNGFCSMSIAIDYGCEKNDFDSEINKWVDASFDSFFEKVFSSWKHCGGSLYQKKTYYDSTFYYEREPRTAIKRSIKHFNRFVGFLEFISDSIKY